MRRVEDAADPIAVSQGIPGASMFVLFRARPRFYNLILPDFGHCGLIQFSCQLRFRK
jgi:hypothetical protein